METNMLLGILIGSSTVALLAFFAYRVKVSFDRVTRNHEDLNTDITASVKENILEQGEDTLTFLGNYVEQIDTDLDKDKLIGLSVMHNTEYLWSTENILNVQVIYVLPEYRSLEVFNNIMKIIKTQANDKAIHLSISTKLVASQLLERVGFEQMGNIWRMK